ncbi:sensor histidine kinase, partial [Virgisporangium aurantiacum]|uniref:sensor histidine kinase n=1 Tax=Virgisporangium aurantiacum TaxID=175570 RepID=UPI003570ABBB
SGGSGVPRGPGGSTGPTLADPAPESLAPAPGLADLDRLAEQAEQAGLRVTTWLDGVHELPEALGLTVYRIVQEALTNAAKYAAPAACRITVRAADGEVAVEVLDDGRGPGRALGGKITPGYGLIGMRERVALFGGTLTTDRLPTGGFRVAAQLPYGAVR